MFQVLLAANDIGPIPGWVLQQLKDGEVEFAYRECTTPEEVVEHGREADVVWSITPLHLLTDYSLSRLPRCLAVLRTGSGTDNVDVEAATREGIVVANTPDAVTEATSDHAVAMLLSLVRHIPRNDRLVRAGHWHTGAGPVQLVHGGTIGLVGLGRIGRRVAQKVSGFNMRILAYDPHVPPEEMRDVGAQKVGLDPLLEEADFVSLHVPLTPQTFHLIGESELRRMSPSAYLVNLARGPVVDEQALCQALAEGWIAGAALDVLEHYPPDLDCPLLRLENVVLSPHIGSAAHFSRQESWRLAAETILDLRQGRWPRSVVNPQVVPRRPLSPR